MTTNAGAEEGSRASIGFTQQDHATDSLKIIEKGFHPNSQPPGCHYPI